MKPQSLNRAVLVNGSGFKVMMLATFMILLIASHYAYAVDLLAGTDTDIKDTIAGTGRHWLLYIDGIAAVLMFATRKNVVILGSILVITVFINVLLFMAK